MPPEVRQLYQMMTSMLADKNQDGVPDIFASGAGDGTPTLFQTTQFVVDGKVYNNLDELPAEARQKYEQAIGQLANRNEIPDLLEHSPLGAVAQPAADAPAPQPYQEPKVTVIGDPQPASRATIMLVGGAVVVVVLVVIAALYLIGRL
jgi:hypothetical protein